MATINQSKPVTRICYIELKPVICTLIGAIVEYLQELGSPQMEHELKGKIMNGCGLWAWPVPEGIGTYCREI